MKNRIIISVCALLALAACGGSSSGGNTPTEEPIIRLYYYGQTPTDGKQGDPAQFAGPHKIYSATSIDGITFTEESGVRFELEKITDPDVFFDGTSLWVMFASEGATLHRATSAEPNGTFVEDAAFKWNEGGVCSTTLISGVYRMYFCSNPMNGIGVATYDPATGALSDPQLALANPHGGGVICDPSVIQLADGTYLMFYKYQAEGASPTPLGHQIYTATSPDGLTWTATMTLVRDKSSVPGAVRISDKIYLYFVDGESNSLGYGIGTDSAATFEFESVVFVGAAESEQVDPHPVALK